MQQTTLNATGKAISAIGLGAMPLSLRGRRSEDEAIEVIHRALDLGVTVIDTADSYCIDNDDFHHNERLIAKALREWEGNANEITVATKGGLLRPEGRWVADGDPDRLRETIRESIEALGGDPIDLWQFHAPDQAYEIEASLEPAAEAADEGLIRHVGVSNFSVSRIERAREVVDVVSVQNQWNPWHRKPERDGVLEYCDDQELTFLPWSPFGGGDRAKSLGEIDVLADLAGEYETSPHCVTLAWMMAKSDRVLPIPGATRRESIEDSVTAVDLELTEGELERIDDELPS
ncbi:MAG: aldo/keto reductase [Bradymonadaceae bacterium]